MELMHVVRDNVNIDLSGRRFDAYFKGFRGEPNPQLLPADVSCGRKQLSHSVRTSGSEDRRIDEGRPASAWLLMTTTRLKRSSCRVGCCMIGFPCEETKAHRTISLGESVSARARVTPICRQHFHDALSGRLIHAFFLG